MDRLDQAVVDADGHVALVQRRLTGGGIAPDRGLVVVHLHRAAVEGREGLPVLPIGAEHGPERLLPDLPAAALPEHAEVALGELDLVPLLVVDLGQLHIHVGEHGIGVGGRLGRVAQHGQHLLPGFVQNVGPAPGDVRRDEPVDRHVLLGQPGGQILLGDGQNLRVQKGHHGHALHQKGHGPGVHGLVLGFAAVSALVEVRIDEGQLDLLHGRVDRVQALLQALLADLHGPGQGGEPRQRLLSFGHGRLPGRLVGIDVGKVPLVLGVHFLALHFVASFLVFSKMRRFDVCIVTGAVCFGKHGLQLHGHGVRIVRFKAYAVMTAEQFIEQ